MKLRKVLFVLIVAILAFDIALIVRHKRSQQEPAPPTIVAKVGPGDPVESFTIGRPITFCQFDGPTHEGDYFVASRSNSGACHDVGFGPPRKPGKSSLVLGFVLTTNNRAGRYAVRLDVGPPWDEPPAPKPAGERKL